MIGKYIVGLLQRFFLIYRWVGFLSLVLMHGWLFVAAPIMNLFFNGETFLPEILEGYVSMLYWNDRRAELGSLLIWIGLTYWPIQWLLSGHKNLFPWGSNT